MRGKETSIDDKTKVMKAKLSNPDLSLRDIEKETGVHFNTVKRIIEDIPKVATSCNKQEIMIGKLDKFLDDVLEIDGLQVAAYKKLAEEETISSKDWKVISDIGKTNFDRRQILKGEPTDIKKHDFDLEGKTMKELDEMRKQIINGN